MKTIIQTIIIGLFSISLFNCSSPKQVAFKPGEIYKSSDLIIIQIAKNSFVHTSYLQTNDFGNVPCNGLIVRNNNETIIFDTPTNEKTAAELIKWIKESLNCKINAIIPTHFHDDCLGGLKAFDDNNIPSYANFKTIELAKAKNYTIPNNGFSDSLILKLGYKHIVVRYFGEGHTVDNVVGYFPADQILFGGCLIKAIDASKGFLGDANIKAWSTTVEKIKIVYPQLKLVVPGHGKYGSLQLLDYTINLFKVQ